MEEYKCHVVKNNYEKLFFEKLYCQLQQSQELVVVKIEGTYEY